MLSPGSVLQAENRAYGHARTLSEYAGFDRTRWIPGALQHGWNPFDGIGMDDGAWRPLPKFVWADDNVKRGKEIGGRNYRAIGAPWLYLLRTPRSAAWPEPSITSGRTLAFPFHATVHTQLVGSHADYARDLAQGEVGRELTVCLQWLDAANPQTREVYEDVGATVVTLGRGTSGAPGHEDFLRRQLELIRRHDRLVSNRLATCVFYGAAAGLEIGVYGSDMRLHGEASYAETFIPKRWPELHGHTVAAGAARAGWQEQLGDRHVLDTPSLREMMGWNDGLTAARIHTVFLGRRLADLVRLNTRRPTAGKRHLRVY